MRSISFLILSVFIFSFEVRAQEKTDSSLRNKNIRWEVGAEYLTPTRYRDRIQTTSANVYYWKKHLKKAAVLIHTGITATYAWGQTRVHAERNDTIFISRQKTSAFGAGPSLQIEFVPIVIGRFSVTAEAIASAILYSNHFPYGGDIYNFMIRTGPSLCYRFNKNYFVKGGYRWMHVSNGKGNGPQNPFYEAWGINLSLVIVR
jgi:hypothetical protein